MPGKTVTWTHGSRLPRGHLVTSTVYTFNEHIHRHVLPVVLFSGSRAAHGNGVFLEQTLQGAGYVYSTYRDVQKA
jgi:hypothetical protein